MGRKGRVEVKVTESVNNETRELNGVIYQKVLMLSRQILCQLENITCL